MKFELDKFNGIIINTEALPSEVDTFKTELAEVVSFSQANSKNIIWLTLPIHRSQFVPVATDFGFIFHNCQEHELTLIRKASTTTFIPFIPTHTLGAGAIVKNAGFNRQMIEALHDANGLAAFEPANNTGPYKKHETFFAKTNT